MDHRALTALLAALAFAPAVAAQDYKPSPGGMPIELSAHPARPLPGSPVTLKGETGRAGDRPVLVVVTPPKAGAESLQAVPDTKGGFQVVYPGTQQLGTYRVRATAPDGKGTANLTFAVAGAAAAPARVASTARRLADATGKAVEATHAAIGSQPASPARDQAVQRLEEVRKKVAETQPHVITLREQMVIVFKARMEVPEAIPEWDEYQTALESWEETAEAAAEHLERVAAKTAGGAGRCAVMDDNIEVLTAASETMSLLQLPSDLSLAFWVDKIPGGLVARATDPQQVTSGKQFALVQTMKLSSAVIQGGMNVVTAVPGLILDVMQYLRKEEFDRYCEKFEGPVTATFVADVFTRQKEPMWSYTILLDGRLLLMYPKGASGAAVALRGYLEGAGRFQVRGNPAPISRLAPGPTLFFTTRSPPGGRYWSEIGRPNQAFLPHSFRIPVEGIFAGDSIVLKLQPADHDFGEMIRGKFVWVIMPTGGLWPEVVAPTVRLQRAHPIIERAIRRRPVLTVLRGPNGMLAQATFVRDSSSAGETARVRTKLTIQACNPGCLPLPLTPGGSR